MQFNQPDTLIPDPYNPLDWNRYSYGRNNPLYYTDPDGHRTCGAYCQGDWIDEHEINFGASWEGEWDTGKQRRRSEQIDRILTGTVETTASIFIEPIDWTLTIRDCLRGDCSPLVLLGLAPFIPSSAGKYAGETVDTIRGRVAHDLYPLFLGPDYDYKVILPSGLKPDAVDWQHHIVRELKPDNPRAIQKGWNQVKKYLSELFEMDGEIWTGYVDGYK